VKVLARFNKAHLIDVLNERLTFERAGVKLYDRLLERIHQAGDSALGSIASKLSEVRGQEKEHEEWLEAQIRTLGGDAHADTEKSELVTRESQGIEKVVMSDAKIPHLFHALLAAELVDNAGWDLLVALADEAKDRVAKRQFKQRLRQEAEHLVFLRRVVAELSGQEVLGKQADLPQSLFEA